MGTYDAQIALFLKNNIVPTIGVLALFTLIVKYGKTFSQRLRRGIGPLILAFFNSFIFPKTKINALKKSLFEPMRGQAERLNRPIDIVEIGAGTGENFRFYPVNSTVTVVEPMVGCHKYIRHNAKKCGRHVELKEIRAGFGEKMDEMFAAGDFDAAVLCDVLCESKNVRLFLEQTYRLLKPGGVLYVNQHAPGKTRGTLEHRLMSLLNPVHRIFTTCDLLGSYLPIIESLGFKEVDMVHREKPLTLDYWPLARTRLVGTAVK